MKIRNMKVNDVETVARMVALDHDNSLEKGYREAKEHTINHLRIVPQHCYVVENSHEQIVAVMVLHPQDKVFEVEDFHVKEIQRNKEALALLKEKLWKYLDDVKTEVLCCPYAIKRLIESH
ncbi:hypothetical protein HXY33_07495 [Candidatus Bathyarchaeota archaeon]|nr:hypothetical protein [Candidatus Bathyarchaeota archaeon]